MLKALKKLRKEDGFFQFIGIILIGLLIFTGLGYMKWGADEAYEAVMEKHRMQAYYTAHAGIMDLAFSSLRGLGPEQIPKEPAYLGRTDVSEVSGGSVGYADVILQPNPNSSSTVFNDTKAIEYRSHGVVQFKNSEGKLDTVSDEVALEVRMLGLNAFFYLTDNEKTPFGEVIKFWHEDTLEGWVHSNDTIAIMENPVFYDRVTTCAPVFWQGTGFNPQFINYEPQFNYREIYLPTEATQIREAAQAMGLFFQNPQHNLQYRLQFRGSQGWIMYSWPEGEPFNPQDAQTYYGDVPDYDAIFVDGYLELLGIVQGQVTVAAHGSYAQGEGSLGHHCIRLMDDIRYWFADGITGQFDDTTGGYTDLLGIVSESNITIANSWANGREAQDQGQDIIITAAMIALGDENVPNYWGSFSFEDQNEADGGATTNPTIWEWYNGSYEYLGNGPNDPDERGDIHLWGAVTQRRRGYVHRSNHGGTGYGKDYHFDDRLRYMAPPFFLDAVDSEGKGFFEIVKWDN